MAHVVKLDVFDEDDTHLVRLQFFGETQEEAEEKRDVFLEEFLEIREALDSGEAFEACESCQEMMPSIDDYVEDDEDEEEEN